ncbi:flagellar assembly protein FliX [Magnetovibrio sp.]|uniref:flagellar assembly protein FliX n=1 Tax=Magnetovibrio sp. TaxID=2024836 RepID=UPI002F93D857
MMLQRPSLACTRLDTTEQAKRMKIGNVDQSKGVDRSKRKKGVSGGGSSAFADQLRGASGGGETSSTEGAVTDSVTLSGVDALLAMQEVGDATDGRARKQAQSYGEDLLDRLTALQDALLRGAIPKENLMEMAKRIRTARVKVQDPKLNAILDAIELRAEVEIAKYARSS